MAFSRFLSIVSRPNNMADAKVDTVLCESCVKEAKRIMAEDSFPQLEDDITPIEIAALAGHPKCLQAVINAGADVNHVDETNHRTPLGWATEHGHVECVKMLIKAGSDVNHVDSNGESPLSDAAKFGRPECLEVLLRAGADVNTTSACNESTLMTACYYGELPCVKLLIEAGADLNHVDGGGYTALMMAATNDESEILKLLIEAGADTSDLSNILLFCAISACTADSINILVKAGADVNFKESGRTPLVLALIEGYAGTAETFIKAGADVNVIDTENDFSVLHYAAGETSAFYYPLREVLEIEDEDIYSDDEDDPVTSDKRDSEHTLATSKRRSNRDSVECVRLMLRSGARINQQNGRGNTALEEALLATPDHVRPACLVLFSAGETVNKVRASSRKRSFLSFTGKPSGDVITNRTLGIPVG